MRIIKLLSSRQVAHHRAMCTFIVVVDFWVLVNFWAKGSLPQAYALYACARIGFFIVAWIFSFVRLSKRYYFSGLREMPVNFYWLNVLLILLAIRALFAHLFFTDQIFTLFQSVIFVYAFFQVSVSYQTKWWLAPSAEWRKRRINYLLGREKANLIKKERKAIEPILEQKGLAYYNIPFVWKVTLFAIAIIVSAFFNSLTTKLVDELGRLGITFSNVLPPY